MSTFHEPADPPTNKPVLVSRERFELILAMAKTSEADDTHEFCTWAGQTYATPLEVKCKACHGRGSRLHGWAVCPGPCETCDGTGVAVTP